MNAHKRNQLVNELKGIQPNELFSIFYEVIGDFRTESYDKTMVDDAIAIAICGYSAEDGKSENELWAEPHESSEYNSDVEGIPAIESGLCSRCKSPIVSNSKRAKCPVCHKLVVLT